MIFTDRQRKLNLLKLKELEEEEEKLRIVAERYKTENKVEFVSFLPHQKKIIDFIEAGKKVILFVSGNRAGKTTLGAILVALVCVP